MLFCTRCSNERGKGRVLHGCRRVVCGFTRGIILDHNLMRQPEARCQVPVRLPVLQGTGESISADPGLVLSRDRDCNPKIYPASHMQNGLIHFRCHESAQICKCDLGLPLYHAININNRQRKMFLLIVAVLTMFVLHNFLPSIQERRHWLKYARIRVIVA